MLHLCLSISHKMKSQKLITAPKYLCGACLRIPLWPHFLPPTTQQTFIFHQNQRKDSCLQFFTIISHFGSLYSAFHGHKIASQLHFIGEAPLTTPSTMPLPPLWELQWVSHRPEHSRSLHFVHLTVMMPVRLWVTITHSSRSLGMSGTRLPFSTCVFQACWGHCHPYQSGGKGAWKKWEHNYFWFGFVRFQWPRLKTIHITSTHLPMNETVYMTQFT